ncbi:MAG TPA: hypothetical protein VMG10_34985 [Gemmataceae bacterium]|nr:hypothetical protein [Gemmataceae bacterium]
MFIRHISPAFPGVRLLLLAGMLMSLAASSGCQTAAGTGAATGATLGYGIAAVASNYNPAVTLMGAAFGTAAGLLGGTAVDAAKAKKAQNAASAAAADAVAHAPSLQDVVNMTHNGVPPEQVVTQIRASGVVYRLSPDQIIWLNQQGVPTPVVNALLETPMQHIPPPPPYPGKGFPLVQPAVGYAAQPPAYGVGYVYPR